jgi:hypothetical protein
VLLLAPMHRYRLPVHGIKNLSHLDPWHVFVADKDQKLITKLLQHM